MRIKLNAFAMSAFGILIVCIKPYTLSNVPAPPPAIDLYGTE